jgi:adenylate cyclase
LLVEFVSAVDAVQCAVETQESLAVENAALPEERRMAFRMGVNLGDVIAEGGTIHGDGVNVAARLEKLAEPNGVCIGRSVYDQVKGKLPYSYIDLGDQRVHNIPEPVRVYRVSLASPGANASSRSSTEDTLPLPDRPSIAVLPFENMSGDPEQQYFSDGITEDIITELSRFRELLVVSRASSFVFRGQATSVMDVAKKLQVNYVVEGSIRKSKNRVRITAQLIDAGRDHHIWAEHYDRDLQDIFEVQDDVVHRITTTLVGRLEHERQDRAKRQSQSALRAYDLYLRGREHFFNWSPEENRKAAELLEAAIAIEPDYAAALALSSEVHQRDWLNGWSLDEQKDCSVSTSKAARSVQLDDGDSRTHTSLGLAHLFNGEPDRAKHHLETALRLNPNDTRALVYLARHATLNGEPERAVEMINRALQLNPFGKYDWYLGIAKFVARHYDEAIDLLRNVRDPGPVVLALLAASLAQAGRSSEARSVCERFLAVAASNPVMQNLKTVAERRDFFAIRWPFKDQGDLKHLLAALQNAGITV